MNITDPRIDVRAVRFGCLVCGDSLRILVPDGEVFDRDELEDTAAPWVRGHWCPRLLAVEAYVGGVLRELAAT